MSAANQAPQTAAKAFDPDELDELVPHDPNDDWRAKMRTIMPWIISLGAHLGVLIIASVAVFAVKTIIEKKDVVIPVAEMGDEEIEGPLDRLPGPVTGEIGPMSDGAPPAPADVAPPMPSAPPTAAPTSRPVASSAVSSFVAAPVSSGISTGAGQASSGQGIFKGVGGFIGGGGEGGGQRAVNRIVFLVDASGSLVDTLPFVLEDLSRMLDGKLEAKKQFNVIFFSGASMNREIGAVKGLASFRSQLVAASPINRKQAVEWIHKVEAGGSSDPLSAVKKALDMDPDQIHLLSDNITGSGIWEMHQNKFMEEMMKAYQKAVAKPSRKTPDGKFTRIQFKTYQFVYPDPLTKIGKEPTLLRIVKDTGGKVEDYTFVTARELGLR